MVIKLNYNILAFIISIIIVVAICAIDYAVPVNVNVENQDEGIKLPVVMYHHLSKSQNRLCDFVISPAQFEEDLKYIKKCGYETISAKQLLDFLEKGTPLPKKPIMITFDDGNESVHEYAYPLLEKYNMKAIISVIGAQIDFYSDETHDRHINYSYLTWNQLREMKQSEVFEIGNHTYNLHDNTGGKRMGVKRKSGESEEDYRRALVKDIEKLSKKIEQEVGEKPYIFAYPFGKFNKETKPIIKDLGFTITFSCEEKVNIIKPNTELPVTIKRFNRASRYSTYDYFKKLGVKA